MSFLKAATTVFIACAVIFIKKHGSVIVEENIPKKDVFISQDFVFSDSFQVFNGKAAFTVKYRDINQNGDSRNRICMVFAMPRDWRDDNDIRVQNSNFDSLAWAEKIKSRLSEEDVNKEENRKGFSKVCSGDRWESEDSVINTVFFDLKEDSDSNTWIFDDKDIEDLFAGQYASKNISN